MNRRQFMHSASAAVALSAATRSLPLVAAPENAKFKISIAPWSLIQSVAGRPDPGGIDLWDYPRVVRELGFDSLEHDNLHFPGELPNDRDIARMRKACDVEGLKSTLILCGALGDIADADTAKRNQAIDKYRAWAGAAKALGCTAIRVVCADRKNEISFEEKHKLAVEGISTLADHNASLGLELLIENHGGYTSDPRWLTGVIREVDRGNCAILADFTHWSVQREPEVNVIDPYDGMKILAPLTHSVSAHAYDFDASGNETKWDYRKFMKILTEAGFDGYVAIEYFGKELSRKDGTRKARRLLERVRGEMS